MERRHREEDLYKIHTECLKCDLGNPYLCVCVSVRLYYSSCTAYYTVKGRGWIFISLSTNIRKATTDSVLARLSVHPDTLSEARTLELIDASCRNTFLMGQFTPKLLPAVLSIHLDSFGDVEAEVTL